MHDTYAHTSILDQIQECILVLALAVVELIFFVAASIGLWFGFVLETVLIIQGCFCNC